MPFPFYPLASFIVKSVPRILIVFTAWITLGASPPTTLAQDESTAQEKPKVTVSKKLPEQLIGYWAIDVEGMIKTTLANMNKERAADTAFVEKMKASMRKQLVSVGMQFTKDKMLALSARGPEEVSYVVQSTDEAKGEMRITVTNPRGETKEGTIRIKGKQMTLKEEGGSGNQDEIPFNRITREEHEKRAKVVSENDKRIKEAIENSK